MQVKGPANTEHASKTPPHSVSQSDWHNWAIKPLVLVTKFGRSGDSLHSSIWLPWATQRAGKLVPCPGLSPRPQLQSLPPRHLLLPGASQQAGRQPPLPPACVPAPAPPDAPAPGPPGQCERVHWNREGSQRRVAAEDAPGRSPQSAAQLGCWDLPRDRKQQHGCRGRVLQSSDLYPPHFHHLTSTQFTLFYNHQFGNNNNKKKTKTLGPCLLFPELSMSSLLSPSEEQNFKSKATSQVILARVKVKAATALCQNPSLQRERTSPAWLQQGAANIWYSDTCKWSPVTCYQLLTESSWEGEKGKREPGVIIRNFAEQVLATLHVLRFTRCHQSLQRRGFGLATTNCLPDRNLSYGSMASRIL